MSDPASAIQLSVSHWVNLVASNLLKYCHYHQDISGDDMELCFLRDSHQREIGFVVLLNGKSIFGVECKSGEKAISKYISYFSKRSSIPCFYQVHLGNQAYEVPDLRAKVMPFTRFAIEVLNV